MNIKDLREQVHTCFHCGNTGKMNYIGKSGWEYEEAKTDRFGRIFGHTLIEHEDWLVFECPVCNKPVVISEYVFDVAGTPPERKIEYPTIAVSPEGGPKRKIFCLRICSENKRNRLFNLPFIA